MSDRRDIDLRDPDRMATPSTPHVIVAHQWRTPMTLIRGCSGTVLQRWDDLTDEQRRRFVSMIHRHAVALHDLLEQALTAMEPARSR